MIAQAHIVTEGPAHQPTSVIVDGHDFGAVCSRAVTVHEVGSAPTLVLHINADVHIVHKEDES
jgi:hypothetical protein